MLLVGHTIPTVTHSRFKSNHLPPFILVYPRHDPVAELSKMLDYSMSMPVLVMWNIDHHFRGRAFDNDNTHLVFVSP